MFINSVNILNTNKLDKVQPYKKNTEMLKNNNVFKPFELPNNVIGSAILAQKNISFRSEFVKRINPYCTIVLTDKQCEPSIHIEVKSKENFRIKQGLFPIYSMSLNDQIYEENIKNGQVITSCLTCTPYSKTIDYKSSQDSFAKSLEMLENCFFNAKINSKQVDTAKKLAPIALFLSRKTDDYQQEFFDIPNEMTEEEYENLVSNITIKDLADYNDRIRKNSNVNINLRLNKDYYNQTSEMIVNYLNNWSNKHEN